MCFYKSKGKEYDFMNKKRLLFLTLGTGKTPESALETLVYKNTNYSIYHAGNNEYVEYESNFVAEPIIEIFEPDEIFVLGTVKSVWYQLFASFITENNEDQSYKDMDEYKNLVEIAKDETLGYETNTEKLREINEQIQTQFSVLKNEGVCKKFSGKALNVNILITKYGIDEKELQENYTIIKEIEEKLKADERYEVAFDITHSFRSLPIYNLIIFNYIKNITRFSLDITNIYYGNLDVKREINYAPIVDLKDLVKVLELTSGVAEFKNTGNASSILQLMEKEDNLKQVLEDFDVAAQVNAFDLIIDNLSCLIEECYKKEESMQHDRYTGMKEMIIKVLESKFFGKDIDSTNAVKQLPVMELKFLLTEWFFNQNRIGLGIATGLEALRDLNTPVFMKTHGFSSEEERRYRENAEAEFIRIAERLKEQDSRNDLEDAVVDIGCSLKEYKQIRNIFAHSLGKNEEKNIKIIRGQIDEFRKRLNQLKKIYDQVGENEYEKLFQKVKKTQKKESNDCRILIELKNTVKQEELKKYKKSNKKQYDVYRIPDDVKQKILKNNETKTYQKAYLLYQYILNSLPKGYENIQVILVSGAISDDAKFIYRLFLEKIEIEKENVKLLDCKNLLSYPLLRIPLNFDGLEKEVLRKYGELEQVDK